MRTSDIPEPCGFDRRAFTLRDLLGRASSTERSSWTDLPQCPGIYVVHWTLGEPPTFKANAGRAILAEVQPPRLLRTRWTDITEKAETDVIYIGSATSLKKRVRELVRFGVGRDRRRRHAGGEWMWQISKIAYAKILIQTCPRGRQVGFENSLLEQFHAEHADWPLSNRDGPKRPDRWWPCRKAE